MFIKLTNQEQKNLLMVLAAIFCLWVVWKLVNHRHDKITGEVMNSGKLRRLLPGGTYEGMTSEEAEELKNVIDGMVEGEEEEVDDEGPTEEVDDEEEEVIDVGPGDEEDVEEEEGFGNYYEGYQKEDDFEQYGGEPFGNTIEGQANKKKKKKQEDHDTCELFYGLKKCSEIDHMEFDSDDDKSAMMNHCKKCKK